MTTLTPDQKEQFEKIKESYINEIKTESAFTIQDKEDVLDSLKKNNDIDLYHFLTNQRPSAPALKLYLKGLKRRTKDRVKEANRTAKHPASYSDSIEDNIRDGIGYANHESKDRVIKELKRLKNKSSATWKSIEKRAKMTKKEILKHYGIE